MEKNAAVDMEGLGRRLELALKPVASPPALEEVLEQVSRRGALRGPVDWVFPAWIAYVEYAVQRIIETFPLTEEEKKQLIHFRDALKRLLLEAWRQARNKLTALYKAVAEDTYRIEGSRLYAPDGTWMYIDRFPFPPFIPIHGASAETYFPDILRLPHERLELLQLGWRASDEFENKGRPAMGTTQPWQLIAWAAARHGELRIRINRVNLTREGISVHTYVVAKSWEQKWSKDKAIDLVAESIRRGEWALLLTMWLGDGETKREEILHSNYKLAITAKEPWRLGSSIAARRALVATGKEAFVRLREAAGAYGKLLDLLSAHKWVVVRLATDDAFRMAYKLRAEKRCILAVAGVEMYLHLVSSGGGSLRAERYVRSVEEALAIAGRLESAGLRPNVVRAGDYYMVYVATADLLRLAERDETIRRAVALYLAEKARSGTQRQREAARKIMQRHSSLFPPTGFITYAQHSSSALTAHTL